MTGPTASTLADGLMLVSFWKPILLFVPFVAWAAVVSRVYDKHATRFHLSRERWNVAHLTAGTIALAIFLFMPIKGEGAFWAGLGAVVLVLAADLASYMIIANRDERVPPEHRVGFHTIIEEMRKKREAKQAEKQVGRSELVVIAANKDRLPVPDRDTPAFNVRIAAEAILLQADELRASDIEILPAGKDNLYGVAYVVDGIRQAGATMSAQEAINIIDFWKSAAGLDVNDRRRRLVGAAWIERHDVRHKVRVVAVGVQGGMRATLTLDPERQVIRKRDDMGLLEPQAKALRELVDEGQGVVLLAAPADMGRTTTLYAVTRMHDAYTSNVHTVESEPQAALEGVRQNTFEARVDGPTHATMVRSILRRDPDVVAVADLTDDETAKEIVRTDQERTRIYVSLRADSAEKAIAVWCRAVGDLAAAGDALHGVVAQKLLRRLCVQCRMPYQPPAEMLKKLGLPPERVKQLYKKGGQVIERGNKPEVCPMCKGSGYLGQEGVFEVVALGPAERDRIKAGDLAGLRSELRKKQVLTIQQVALRKAIEGVTSIEEVMRITSSGGSGSGGAAKSPEAKAPASA